MVVPVDYVVLTTKVLKVVEYIVFRARVRALNPKGES